MNTNAIYIKSRLSGQQLAIMISEYEKKKKSTGLAYVLLICFGIFGIHRFYLNDVVFGIIYLLSLGLLGLGVLWDLFFTASMVSKRNEQIEANILTQLTVTQLLGVASGGTV